MLVTVVLPTYRRSRFLGRAIESVLRQTHEEFELIVVDDASPECDTPRIVEQVRDPRVRFIRRETNGGPAASRNTAVRAGTGPLIAFLDDDDEYYPECLKSFVQAFAAVPGSSYAWCAWDQIREEGGVVRIETIDWAPDGCPDRDRAKWVRSWFMNPRPPTGALAIRRSLFDRVGGFDESLRAAVDTDLWLRLLECGEPMRIRRSLFRLNAHDGPRVTDRGVVRAEALERILAKHVAIMSGDPELQALWHHKISWQFAHGADLSRARAHARRSLQLHPRLRAALTLGAMCTTPRLSALVRELGRRSRKAWARIGRA